MSDNDFPILVNGEEVFAGVIRKPKPKVFMEVVPDTYAGVIPEICEELEKEPLSILDITGGAFLQRWMEMGHTHRGSVVFGKNTKGLNAMQAGARFLDWGESHKADLIVIPKVKAQERIPTLKKARTYLKNEGMIVALLETVFLHGWARYRELFTEWRPYKIIVLPGRPRGTNKKSGTYSYSWWFWKKKDTDNPIIDWMLNPVVF